MVWNYGFQRGQDKGGKSCDRYYSSKETFTTNLEERKQLARIQASILEKARQRHKLDLENYVGLSFWEVLRKLLKIQAYLSYIH